MICSWQIHIGCNSSPCYLIDFWRVWNWVLGEQGSACEGTRASYLQYVGRCHWSVSVLDPKLLVTPLHQSGHGVVIFVPSVVFCHTLVTRWHSGHGCGAAAGFRGLTFHISFEGSLWPVIWWSEVQSPLAHDMPGCLLEGTDSIQPQIFRLYSSPWGVDQLHWVKSEIGFAFVAPILSSRVKKDDASFSPLSSRSLAMERQDEMWFP